ncbi:uracil-DNA glycosylase family protein [Sphingomonas japonica]|uniref:DNA polymerase n=1 Tax=Sphingomonas japonica TaxID=511662 RepID=A0ABX0U3B1_9SPHN|nr:uracil-DNA glycosylase family protein [Sphingomonas japonica]NIJ25070.1 DNA polymerase [Sphingomonas japonica]
MGVHQHIDRRAQIASTLLWWHDAGIDALVDDDPRDWLAPAVASPPAQDAAAVPVAPSLPGTVEDFLAWRRSGDAIERRWGAAPIAPEGDPAAAIHIVVDSPGDGEAYLGGDAGRLFDRMLAAIGLDRGTVCISGVAWAPVTAGRLSADDEQALAALTLHFLGLARPKRVLLFGQSTSRALLGTDGARRRGLLHAINHRGAELKLVASWHPRFLLERPVAKADAWHDLQLLIGGMNS